MRLIAIYSVLITVVFLISCKKEVTISTKQSVSFIKFFGTPFSNYGNAVCKLSDGGYVITGSTTNLNNLIAADVDVILIRTDQYGNEKWAPRTIGGKYNDAGNSLCLAPDGGFVIAGTFGDSTSQGYTTDVYLIRTNADGDTLWTRRFGGILNEGASCVKATPDGGFVLAGYREIAGMGKDVWIIKTDQYGIQEWEKSTSTDLDEYARQIFVIDGGYILCGTSISNSYNLGTESGFVMKTGPTGNMSDIEYVWGLDPITDGTLSYISEGNYLFAGTKTNTINVSKIVIAKITTETDIKVGPVSELSLDGSYAVKDIKVVDGGCVYTGSKIETSDIMILRTDMEGNVVFSKSYGSSGAQEGLSILQANDGGYVVAGYNRFETNNSQITLMKVKSDGTQ